LNLSDKIQRVGKPKMKIFFSVILILLALFMTGCALTPSPTPMPDSSKTIRFLALGDSYTIGQSVPEPERWPVQLAAQLKQRGEKVDLTIIARTGWTVRELWQGIQYDPPQGTYDLVSLLIGVNDQYRGGSVTRYREDFRFLLEKAIGYAGGEPKRVVVLSIPDWGATPYAQNDSRSATQIAAEIDAFNAVNKDETQKTGARYVDVTPVSRQTPADPALIADDGLHPSGKMYAAWADLALPEALAVLGIGQ
jgi:lysophospholipase L1-like esterase